jgi:hypothetical protein
MMSKSSRPSGQIVLGVVHPVQKQGYWGVEGWRFDHMFHYDQAVGDNMVTVSRCINRRCVDNGIGIS